MSKVIDRIDIEMLVRQHLQELLSLIHISEPTRPEP